MIFGCSLNFAGIFANQKDIFDFKSQQANIKNQLDTLMNSKSLPKNRKNADLVNGNLVIGKNNVVKSSSISQNVVTNNNNVFIPSTSSSSIENIYSEQ
jgi:hypothetical protein